MIRFINRDWTRTEHDDFRLNIEPSLCIGVEAIPQYVDGKLVGWVIQPQWE